MAHIQGSILKVIFQQKDYVVASFSVHKADTDTPAVVTVAGSLYGLEQLQPGVTIGLRGTWGTHPKYGVQLKLEGWEPYARNGREAGLFLSQCIANFHDVGFANKVAYAFDNPLDVLTNHPEKVVALFPPETPEAREVEAALRGWKQARAQMDLAAYLVSLRLAPSVIRAIFAFFGTDALSVLKENPYNLVLIPGFTFAQADQLAMQVGIDPTDVRRVEGTILYALKCASAEGHMCLPRAMLPSYLREALGEEAVEPFGAHLGVVVTEALDRMVAAQTIRIDPAVGVYLPVSWRYERHSAQVLAKFIQHERMPMPFSPEDFLAEYENQNQIELSDDQREGVLKLCDNRVLVLTGLPGTGKTTLVRTLVALFQRLGVEVTLMAPTGIASKRLAAVTGHDAATVHRTLQYTGDSWGYHVQNKLTAPAVIVDEMSMVDQELFYRIMDALSPGTFVVLVGDSAQLPSVGPGNVLRELLGCPEVPHVRLTQIFRQAQTSAIIRASHSVYRGEVPPLRQAPDSDFQFVPMKEEDIPGLVVKMAEKMRARKKNFQVLSPKYDGVTGVTNLNECLREAINPDRGQAEWKAGKLHMRVGDRVMTVKNNYQLAVYNGDMGKLVEITKEVLRVRIYGVGQAVDTYVDIPKQDAPEMLRLAYAITVHKSQGSEFGDVILPVVRGHGRMLQRNLLYTALTRAKQRVWVLGDPTAFQRAIANDSVLQRHTGFARALSRALAGVEDPL